MHDKTFVVTPRLLVMGALSAIVLVVLLWAFPVLLYVLFGGME